MARPFPKHFLHLITSNVFQISIHQWQYIRTLYENQIDIPCSLFPFPSFALIFTYIWWKQPPCGKKNEQKSSATTPDVIGGFTINWRPKNFKMVGTKGKSVGFWKQRNNKISDRRNANLQTAMNLARESKINQIDTNEVWQTLLKHRWSDMIMKDNFCLDEQQEHNLIVQVSQELHHYSSSIGKQ